MASKNSRTKRTRVSYRNDKMCGVHLGGCMTLVERKPSLDHMIPVSFFENPAFGANPHEFNQDWNLQVMHEACNGNRGGVIHGLPSFQCPCHYYRVIDEDLYVCYSDSQSSTDHLLMKQFVLKTVSGDPRSVGLRVEPVSNNPKSWRTKDGILRIEPSNTSIHFVSCIDPSMVKQFNDRERQRVHMLQEAGRSRGPMSVVYFESTVQQ